MKMPANHTPVCPLCGHDGQKQVTQRPMEFHECLKAPTLTLFKCSQCQTIFADSKAESPFEVLERAV
jgi:hypothetical protein